MKLKLAEYHTSGEEEDEPSRHRQQGQRYMGGSQRVTIEVNWAKNGKREIHTGNNKVGPNDQTFRPREKYLCPDVHVISDGRTRSKPQPERTTHQEENTGFGRPSTAKPKSYKNAFQQPRHSTRAGHSPVPEQSLMVQKTSSSFSCGGMCTSVITAGT